MGYDKIIVILTRPAGYQKKKSNSMLPKIYYKQYPKFVETIENRYKKYNEEVEKVEELEKQGKVFLIRPSKLIKIKRVEKDCNKIQEMYDLGQKDAIDNLEKLKQYLD